MKRIIARTLSVPAFAIPFVFSMMVAEPLAGPGLRAADCRYKAEFKEGTMHCHEEGTNCVMTCPAVE